MLGLSHATGPLLGSAAAAQPLATDGAAVTVAKEDNTGAWPTPGVALGFGAGNNRLLLLLLAKVDPAPSDIPTPTYNGVAGTRVTAADADEQGQQALAYLWFDADLPASAGSYTLNPGCPADNLGWLVAQPFVGARQTVPPAAGAVAANAANSSVSLTPGGAGGWIYDALCLGDVRGATAGAGQTVVYADDEPTFTNEARFSRKSVTAAGSPLTMSWTFTAANRRGHAAVSIEPAGSSGGGGGGGGGGGATVFGAEQEFARFDTLHTSASFTVAALPAGTTKALFLVHWLVPGADASSSHANNVSLSYAGSAIPAQNKIIDNFFDSDSTRYRRGQASVFFLDNPNLGGGSLVVTYAQRSPSTAVTVIPITGAAAGAAAFGTPVVVSTTSGSTLSLALGLTTAAANSRVVALATARYPGGTPFTLADAALNSGKIRDGGGTPVSTGNEKMSWLEAHREVVAAGTVVDCGATRSPGGTSDDGWGLAAFEVKAA